MTVYSAKLKANLTLTPSYELGVSSNDVIVKIKNRCIGYVESCNVPDFMADDFSSFTPVENWKNTFSVKLVNRLNLN